MKYSHSLLCMMILSISSLAIADDNGKTSAIKPLDSDSLQSNEIITIGQGQTSISGFDTGEIITAAVKQQCPISYNPMPTVSLSVASFGPSRSDTTGNLSASEWQTCFTQMAAALNGQILGFTGNTQLQFYVYTSAHQTNIEYEQKWHSGWWIFGRDNDKWIKCTPHPIQMTVNYTITCTPKRS